MELVSIEPFSILAADPGGTTGIAVAVYSGTPNPTIEDFYIRTLEFGPKEHHNELWDFLCLRYNVGNQVLPIFRGKKHLITESFEFRQNLDKRKVELISKEYIGLFKLFAQQTGVIYFERNASQAKKFVSDEKLDRLGILEVPKHPNRHRNDALRHLIMYLVVNLRIQTPITDKWRN